MESPEIYNLFILIFGVCLIGYLLLEIYSRIVEKRKFKKLLPIRKETLLVQKNKEIIIGYIDQELKIMKKYNAYEQYLLLNIIKEKIIQNVPLNETDFEILNYKNRKEPE